MTVEPPDSATVLWRWPLRDRLELSARAARRDAVLVLLFILVWHTWPYALDALGVSVELEYVLWRAVDLVAVIALTVAVLLRTGAPLSSIGVHADRLWRQVLRGFIGAGFLYFVMLLGMGLMLWMERLLMLKGRAELTDEQADMTQAPFYLTGAWALIAVLGTELLYDGLLLTRLRRWLGSSAGALALTCGISVLVSARDGYWQAGGALLQTLALGLLFLRTNSIASTVIASLLYGVVVEAQHRVLPPA